MIDEEKESCTKPILAEIERWELDAIITGLVLQENQSRHTRDSFESGESLPAISGILRQKISSMLNSEIYQISQLREKLEERLEAW